MGTAVAKITNIRGVLDVDLARQRIEPFLMPGVDYNRVMAAAHYAARQLPAILECTPHSIIDAVARIQQWQLEIGTTAHLVPFNVKVSKKGEPDQWAKVCTPIADYKGLAELMVRSKAVRHVEARVVYKGDQFSYSYGLDATVQHIPNMAAKDRGHITHAYVVLRLPFGQSSFEVMPIEDIDEIRTKHSKQWNKGPCPAWYAKKTVVRQVAKLVPKDPRFAQALAVIEDEEVQEFGQPVLSDGATAGALMAGDTVDASDDVMHSARAMQDAAEARARENEIKSRGYPAPAQYADGEPLVSEGRVSMQVDPDSPDYYDGINDELPLDDSRPTGRANALRDGQ